METQEHVKEMVRQKYSARLLYRTRKRIKAHAVVRVVAPPKCITLWLMITHS